jgi:hypothetical protein
VVSLIRNLEALALLVWGQPPSAVRRAQLDFSFLNVALTVHYPGVGKDPTTGGGGTIGG